MSSLSWQNNIPDRNRQSGQRNSNTTNEVEIVCLNEDQTSYATNIERKLKDKGLKVDILFPNPNFPIEQILGAIAARKVLYAVVVSGVSSENRSITLFTLQGEPQEHRNIPTSQAIDYIIRNYSRQMGKPFGSVIAQRPVFDLPRNVKYILQDFCDDKPLGISEYDALLKFLVQERENRLKDEYGMLLPPHLLIPPSVQEEP